MDFKSYLQTQYRYKTQTIQQKERFVKQWKTCISTKENFDILTTTALFKIIALQKQQYTSQSLNARIQALEQYFYYLIEIKKRKDHPLKNFRIKTEKPKLLKGFLSEEELTEIYTNYPKTGHYNGRFNLFAQRNKVLLGFIIYQAIPTRDLERLRLQNIDLQETTITITGRKLPLEAIQILDLQQYIHTTRQEIIKVLQLETTDLVFPRTAKTRLTSNLIALKKKTKTYYDIESIKQLRDSRIVLWLKIYNVREVQYKTGYKSLMSLEQYNQNKLEALKQAVEKYHPL